MKSIHEIEIGDLITYEMIQKCSAAKPHKLTCSAATAAAWAMPTAAVMATPEAAIAEKSGAAAAAAAVAATQAILAARSAACATVACSLKQSWKTEIKLKP